MDLYTLEKRGFSSETAVGEGTVPGPNGDRGILSGTVGSCGDATIQCSEDCDGTDLGGETCVSQGFDSGTLACDGGCGFDTSACVGSCLDPGEGLGCNSSTLCCSGVGNCTGGKPSNRVCQ